jgi:hypothetical protein
LDGETLGFFVVTNGSNYTTQQQLHIAQIAEFVLPAAIAYSRILQNNNDTKYSRILQHHYNYKMQSLWPGSLLTQTGSGPGGYPLTRFSSTSLPHRLIYSG